VIRIYVDLGNNGRFNDFILVLSIVKLRREGS
jgi:hypothetical protein